MTMNASLSAMRNPSMRNPDDFNTLAPLASGRALLPDSVPSSLAGSKSPLFVGTRFSEAKN